MARLIKSTGEEIQVTPENGKKFSLKELQSFVGGYIEIVYLTKELMVVNEEGKLNNLPYNAKATDVFNRGGDFIVGDVLIASKKEIN